MKQDNALQEKGTIWNRETSDNRHAFYHRIGDRLSRLLFVERHWHHYIEILYIIKGSYSFEINLQNYKLEAGDICILNSGDLHQITGDSSDTMHDVVLFDPCILAFGYGDEFQEACIQPIVEQLLVLPNLYRKGSPEHACICSNVQKLMQTAVNRENGWYMKSKLLILDILAAIYQAGLLLQTESVRSYEEQQKIQHYKAVISYMEEHYSQPVTLQNLADTVPCSSQYLCRFFKDIAGIPPIQYLIHLRVNRACYLFEHTSKSVLEVALDCGFENVSYFIRKFKEIKGCTPKEYRNMQKD